MENRLAAESSPYLRQHLDNPVHWQPWDTNALAAARELDRPILLSIGYSACHWCHVMAHECFEDEAIASVMNRHFVNIKVDREQRPDLDRIYQLAHQALTGRGGGWPLTVFLTADDLLPFFAGTYFPPTPRHGLPAFPELLQGIARHYEQRRDDIDAQNQRIRDFFDAMAHSEPSSDPPDRAPWRQALDNLARSFDPIHGGHKGAPKFPHAQELRLWLRALPSATATAGIRHDSAATVLVRGLDGMARGGLYDHLGGGFFRYCVDDSWSIPHFEKMLYDNAQLLPVYAEAALCMLSSDSERTHSADAASLDTWLNTAAGMLEFLERDLRSTRGGFHCALDADSSDGEGAYYVWTPQQIHTALPRDQAMAMIHRYGLNLEANFEERAWHLIDHGAAAASIPDVASTRQAMVAAARQTLLAQRQLRPSPGLDDKLLTSWNALTIAGLARTARALRSIAQICADAPERQLRGQDPQHLIALAARAQAMANDALDLLFQQAWREGRLYADHERRFPGYLDDYAFLLDALIEQLQQRWRARDVDWACALAQVLLDRFQDHEHGGFHFTADDHEALPQRPRPWTDDATPGGNGVAAKALLVLAELLGESQWHQAAQRCLRAGADALQRHPQACASLLLALDESLDPPAQLVFGYRDDVAVSAWQPTLERFVQDRARVFRVRADHGSGGRLPPMMAASLPGPAVAWLCRSGTCSPAVLVPEDLAVLLA